MSRNRQVGTFRSSRARGASVPLPARDRQVRFAFAGRVLLALLGLCLTVLAGVGVLDAYRTVNARRIATVTIEGPLHYVSEDDIKASVSRFVATSLVALDLAQLKLELENQPWISKVQVRREWPDTLLIQVEEEQAIARWGETRLVNQQGQIFTPQNIAEQLALPRLTGPQHSEELVMLQYLQFNQLLYPLGVRIRDLTVNERGAWTMTLTNGVEVRLGSAAVLERLRRLVVFLGSEHGQQMPAIQAIDLRYRNGVAVAHRPAQEQTDVPVVAL
jgi:cell division protein FtsQ